MPPKKFDPYTSTKAKHKATAQRIRKKGIGEIVYMYNYKTYETKGVNFLKRGVYKRKKAEYIDKVTKWDHESLVDMDFSVDTSNK